MPRTSAAFDRLPSDSASTREMNRFSNSRLASPKRIPFATISSIRRSSFSFTALLELQAAQEPERLDVFLARLLDDVAGERGHGRLLVPADRLEVVAHELLVEARLRTTRRIVVARPEARRIGRQRLVDEDDLIPAGAVGDAAEFEFRVGDDDAALPRRRRRLVNTAAASDRGEARWCRGRQSCQPLLR